MNNANQLGKIIAVEHILLANPNGITCKEIIEKLDNVYGITAERKSIHSNISVLTRFLPIFTRKQGYSTLYYLQRSEK